MIELFDFLKIIFTDPSKYSSISNIEKRKYSFICNRRFSIQFPLQANALQHVKINSVAVVDFWQNFLRKQYKSIPNWMFIKGVKKTKEEKETKTSVSEEIINEYSKRFEIDRKSILDALEFYPDEIKEELNQYKKFLNQNERTKS